MIKGMEREDFKILTFDSLAEDLEHMSAKCKMLRQEN
jgi:hypothetical protein